MLRHNRHQDLTLKLAGQCGIDIGVAAEDRCGELPTGQRKRSSSGEIAPVEGEQGEHRRENGDSKENADMARCETLA